MHFGAFFLDKRCTTYYEAIPLRAIEALKRYDLGIGKTFRLFFDNCIHNLQMQIAHIHVTDVSFRFLFPVMVSKISYDSFRFVANLYIWGVDPKYIYIG